MLLSFTKSNYKCLPHQRHNLTPSWFQEAAHSVRGTAGIILPQEACCPRHRKAVNLRSFPWRLTVLWEATWQDSFGVTPQIPAKIFLLWREKEKWNFQTGQISQERNVQLVFLPPASFYHYTILLCPRDSICKPCLPSVGTFEVRLTSSQRAEWHYLWIPCNWLGAEKGGCQFCKGSIICCSRRSAPERSFACEDECWMHAFPLLSPPRSCWISHSSEHSPESASLLTSQKEEKTLCENGALMVCESEDS